MGIPELIRNIAFIGQLHHGKTQFMDVLVHQTHSKPWPKVKETRYTVRHSCCNFEKILFNFEVSKKRF